MSKKIGIYYNPATLEEFRTGRPIKNLEEDLLSRKIAQIEAEFLHEFGFPGTFVAEFKETGSSRNRVAYRFRAGDARTGAALKRKPGWMAKFL